MIYFTPTTRTPQRAIALPLVALCLLGLVGVVAIVIDGGFLLDMRRQVQMASDAAALAAAIDQFTNYPKNNGTDPNGTATKSALTTAAANGFTNGGNSTVTVNIPPKSGAFTGQAGYVEVIIKYQQGRFFSAIWGSGKLPVVARAVARGIWKPSGIGLLLLDPNGQGALSCTGNGGVTVNNGGKIVVDSNNPGAISLTGNGTVQAQEIDVTGAPGVSTTGNGNVQGTLKTGVSPTPDPLAALPVPTPPLPLQTYSGQSILSPGTYVGGISLSGQSSVTLQPGFYYLQGGGISLSGQASITGTGVTIYNDAGGSISLSGQGSVTLSPMTSGPYGGITIFQDRTNTQTVSLSGKGGLDLSGTLYAPAATFSCTGNGGVNNFGSEIIGYDVSCTGNGGVTINPAAGPTNKRQIQLVE